ncbi:MAG: oligosaccharide flippase family protein, partial [Acidobacteriales bacterium]|nr:oligosaccharide flippase family protein [Terriglobales bacterium]
GAGDRKSLNETFMTALVATIAAAALICAASLALIRILPDFVNLDPGARPVFSRVVLLLALSVAIMFPARLLGSYLCALQRFDLSNLVEIATTAARFVALIAVVRLGYGIDGVAAVTVANSMVALSLFYWNVRRTDPELSFDWRLASRRRFRELIGFSMYVFLASVGNDLRFQFSFLIIGRWVGLASVTAFNVASRIMDYFKSILLGIQGPLLPTMSELEGRSKSEELRALFLRSTRVTALVSLSIGCMLYLNGKSLLRFWVGEQFVGSYPILMTLTMAYVIALMQSPSMPALYARGRHNVVGWWTLAEGIANVLLSIYWAQQYGLIGVALGTAVPMIASKLMLQLWYTLHTVGVRFPVYFRQSLVRPLLVTGLFLSVSGMFDALNPASAALPFGLFIWQLAWQSSLLIILIIVIGVTRKERDVILYRGKRIVAGAVASLASEPRP